MGEPSNTDGAFLGGNGTEIECLRDALIAGLAGEDRADLVDNTLFLAKNGTSLNVSSVKAIVAKYEAGIRKKVSIHTLRHTFDAHKADKHMFIATHAQIYSPGADQPSQRDG